MFAVILAATINPHPVDHQYPDVRIEDALAFGIDPVSCRNAWLQCQRHRQAMQSTIAGGWNNNPAVVSAWETECSARERAWYLLDDALFCDLPLKSKLRSLTELRNLLGPSDYHAGRMVSPFPNYRIPSR